MGKISRRDALDDELAEVAGLSDSKGPDAEGTMAVPDPPEPRAAVERAAPKANWGLLATLLVMVGAIVALFMFGFKDAAVYSIPVDKLLADGPTGRRVRIDGELVPGSLARRDKPCEYRFRIKGGGRELDVHYPQCVVPDTFRDVPQGGVMVTAEGKLTPAGYFEASLILAKCSSKYDPQSHTMGDKKSAPTDAM